MKQQPARLIFAFCALSVCFTGIEAAFTWSSFRDYFPSSPATFQKWFPRSKSNTDLPMKILFPFDSVNWFSGTENVFRLDPLSALQGFDGQLGVELVKYSRFGRKEADVFIGGFQRDVNEVLQSYGIISFPINQNIEDSLKVELRVYFISEGDGSEKKLLALSTPFKLLRVGSSLDDSDFGVQVQASKNKEDGSVSVTLTAHRDIAVGKRFHLSLMDALTGKRAGKPVKWSPPSDLTSGSQVEIQFSNVQSNNWLVLEIVPMKRWWKLFWMRSRSVFRSAPFLPMDAKSNCDGSRCWPKREEDIFPLFQQAVRTGSFDWVEGMLKMYGPRLARARDEGLAVSVPYGDFKIMERLQKFGFVDVNAYESWLNTAVDTSDYAMVDYILNKVPLQRNDVNDEGEEPVEEESTDTAKEANANSIEVASEVRIDAFLRAVRNKNVGMAEVFLKSGGVDVNCRDKAALKQAIVSNDEEMFQMLRLHHAQIHGSMALYALKAGASDGLIKETFIPRDLNKKNMNRFIKKSMKSNRDPLLLNLAYSHDSEITHGCLSHQILLRAVDFEKTQMLDNFLANNYDVDSNDGELLLRAIRSKRQKMVEYLLGKGAKPLLYFGSLNPKKCGCGDKGILLACWNTLKAEEQETIHSSIRQSLIDHHGIPAGTEEKSTDIISIGNGAVVKKVLVYPENVLQAVQNGDWDALYKHYAGDYQKMFQVIEDNANLVEYKMQNPNQKKEFLKHLAEEGNIFVMVAFFEPNKKALQDKPGSKFVPFQGGPALHDSLKIAVERNDIAVVEFLLSKRGREYEVNFNELLKLAQKNEEMTQVLQRDISKM